MLFDLAARFITDDWCPVDSRFWNLLLHDRWLLGTQYSDIPYPFNAEHDKSKRPLKMFDKRPSIRLQLPMIGADIIKNKLFAPGRFPQFVHDNQKMVDAVNKLVRKAKLDRAMLNAAYWGQSGSVGMGLSLIKGKPVVKTWHAHQCTPRFDDAGELARLDIHYPVAGSYMKALGMTHDHEGTEIADSAAYWYCRMIDPDAIYTMVAAKYETWNPAQMDMLDLPTFEPLTKPHEISLDFPLCHWVRNGGVEVGSDGMSTFGLALPNCMALDYTLSQLQRGINAAATPTVVTKGRVLNFENSDKIHMGPNAVIQLEGDRTDGPGISRSGADAKYLEMTGRGIEVGMSEFAQKVGHLTKDAMFMSTKDVDTIQGAISGKALEIINEIPLDAIRVQQSAYGEYGLLQVVVKLGTALNEAGNKDFKDITQDQLEELELKFPDFYETTGDEAQPLVDSMMKAVGSGFVKHSIAGTHVHSHLGIDQNSQEGNDSEDEAGRQKVLEVMGKKPEPEGDKAPAKKPAAKK